MRAEMELRAMHDKAIRDGQTGIAAMTAAAMTGQILLRIFFAGRQSAKQLGTDDTAQTLTIFQDRDGAGPLAFASGEAVHAIEKTACTMLCQCDLAAADLIRCVFMAAVADNPVCVVCTTFGRAEDWRALFYEHHPETTELETDFIFRPAANDLPI